MGRYPEGRLKEGRGACSEERNGNECEESGLRRVGPFISVRIILDWKNYDTPLLPVCIVQRRV